MPSTAAMASDTGAGAAPDVDRDAVRQGVTVLVPAYNEAESVGDTIESCLLYTSPSPRDRTRSRMPSSA